MAQMMSRRITMIDVLAAMVFVYLAVFRIWI